MCISREGKGSRHARRTLREADALEGRYLLGSARCIVARRTLEEAGEVLLAREVGAPRRPSVRTAASVTWLIVEN